MAAASKDKCHSLVKSELLHAWWVQMQCTRYRPMYYVCNFHPCNISIYLGTSVLEHDCENKGRKISLGNDDFVHTC